MKTKIIILVFFLITNLCYAQGTIEGSRQDWQDIRTIINENFDTLYHGIIDSVYITGSGGQGIAIGNDSTTALRVTGLRNIAIGDNAIATEDDCIAIGFGTRATGADQVMVGNKNYANPLTSGMAYAFGDGNITSQLSITIGTNNQANGSAILIGDRIGFGVGHASAVAIIPNNPVTSGQEFVAVGDEVEVVNRGVALGEQAKANQTNGIAIGYQSELTTTGVSLGSIAIGRQAKSLDKARAIAIGYETVAPANDAARIGGQMVFEVPSSTRVQDTDLLNGEITFYLDETSNKLMIRIKYSDGTLKTGEVNLL